MLLFLVNIVFYKFRKKFFNLLIHIGYIPLLYTVTETPHEASAVSTLITPFSISALGTKISLLSFPSPRLPGSIGFNGIFFCIYS